MRRGLAGNSVVHPDIKCELYANKFNFLIAANGLGEIATCDGFRAFEPQTSEPGGLGLPVSTIRLGGTIYE